MKCSACGRADLISSRFTFERIAPSGARLSMEIDGFVCPACGEEVMLGRDAERVSAEWQRLTGEKAPSR